jgi:4-hydroxy-tetrahydrodipicolinate synthase
MIQRIRPIRPDFSFLTGWDPAIAAMILMGCDGGTNATAGVLPELMRSVYDASVEGRWNEAVEKQFSILPLFDAMLAGVDFPEGFRIGVALRGFDVGVGRQPLSESHRGRVEKLRRDLDELLNSRPGFVGSKQGAEQDEPKDAAAPIASADSVDRIVRAVLEDLRRGEPRRPAD